MSARPFPPANLERITGSGTMPGQLHGQHVKSLLLKELADIVHHEWRVR